VTDASKYRRPNRPGASCRCRCAGATDLLSTDLLDANETISAAMSEALADSGNSPGARLERLYRGYGLLVTGNVMVDRT
jgi:hypothetical protein